MRDDPFGPGPGPRQSGPAPLPAVAEHKPTLREEDVQLAAMVPLSVKRAVRRRAEEEGTTVRGIILRALKQAGIAEVDEAEIADRRIAAGADRRQAGRIATGRSRLWTNRPMR